MYLATVRFTDSDRSFSVKTGPFDIGFGWHDVLGLGVHDGWGWNLWEYAELGHAVIMEIAE